MGPVVNDMSFAQHHPSGPNNPHVYSHSPTHSSPRTNTVGSQNSTPPARNAHSVSDQANSSGDSTENGSPNSANETDTVLIASSTSSVEVRSVSKVFNGNESSRVEDIPDVKRDSYKQDAEPVSLNSVASTVINGELNCTEVMDDAVVPESICSQEEVANPKIDIPPKPTAPTKDFVDHVDRNSATVSVKIESSSLKPILVNGGVETSNNSSNSDKISTKCRDISADLEASSLSEADRDPKTSSCSKQPSDTKSKGQAVGSSIKNNQKSQGAETNSVTSAANGNSSNDLIVAQDSTSGEFPNLESGTSVAIANSSETKKTPTEPSYTKTWASIASVKTNIPMDGATALRSSQSGGSNMSNNHDSYYKAADQFVPMQQDDGNRDGPDLSNDENDPVAIRLGEHLQKYNLDHRSIPLSPRGLCNQSNYCFLNATLQVRLVYYFIVQISN